MPHTRKLKLINLTLDGQNFEGQLRQCVLANNTADGEKLYAFDGSETREETDPDFALELGFYSDWRSDGINQFLWDNDGQRISWSAKLHPDIAAENVTFSGFLIAKAPPVGGEVRTTEQMEITLQVEGKPTLTRSA